MYTPPAFASGERIALDQLAAQAPFVTLITPGHGPLPQISHLPVLYRRDQDKVVLEGHWARPNPQAKTSAQALAILQGPHAYVSPGWYPDKLSAGRVPTWNYAIAHLHGRLHTIDDEDALADLIERLSDRFEATVGGDWRFDRDEPGQRRMLRGIVGFRFETDSFELKLKLSQNHPEANIDAVIAHLAEQPSTLSRDTANWMQRWRPDRTGEPT